jgi:hypothetical protein
MVLGTFILDNAPIAKPLYGPFCLVWEWENIVNKFNRNDAELIIYIFLTLTEIETQLKLKIQKFLAKPYTSKELYDFLIGIKTDLAKLYTPPEDDEPKMIDLEWCEDQLSKPSGI